MDVVKSQYRDQGARTLLVAASLVIVVAGLRAARAILLPFLVSILLAIISLPLMAWLQKKRFPTTLAVLCTVVIDVAVLAGLVLVVGQSLNQFTDVMPRYQGRLKELVGLLLTWLDANGITLDIRRSARCIQP